MSRSVPVQTQPARTEPPRLAEPDMLDDSALQTGFWRKLIHRLWNPVEHPVEDLLIRLQYAGQHSEPLLETNDIGVRWQVLGELLVEHPRRARGNRSAMTRKQAWEEFRRTRQRHLALRRIQWPARRNVDAQSQRSDLKLR